MRRPRRATAGRRCDPPLLAACEHAAGVCTLSAGNRANARTRPAASRPEQDLEQQQLVGQLHSSAPVQRTWDNAPASCCSWPILLVISLSMRLCAVQARFRQRRKEKLAAHAASVKVGRLTMPCCSPQGSSVLQLRGSLLLGGCPGAAAYC